MAIITLSRQVAAHGDEVAQELAAKLGYSFVRRQEIEKRIVELGFPSDKLPKFDERKPGFFASLTKERDEYLNLVQLAMIEAAARQNVIIIGRGAFQIFKGIENHISARIVADDDVRKQRLMEEFNWNEKQAQQRISESDLNRDGFHKNFYNVDVSAATNYHFVLNTGKLSVSECAQIIADYAKIKITPQADAKGKKQVEEMLKAQTVVNKLIFEYKLKIEFIHAEIQDGVIELFGVTDSAAISQQAVRIVQQELPDYTVKSSMTVVQDFKNYQ